MNTLKYQNQYWLQEKTGEKVENTIYAGWKIAPVLTVLCICAYINSENNWKWRFVMIPPDQPSDLWLVEYCTTRGHNIELVS